MAESQDDGLQLKIDQLFDIVLNLCQSIIKANVKGIEEFIAILNDLQLSGTVQKDIVKVFQVDYLARME
tara:strand:+ start:187 stop:393 length:207 start_codon:yes stop_codon:yes gene_type:complete